MIPNSDRAVTSSPRPVADDPANERPESLDDALDMSMRSVPQTWVDAQEDAPIPYGEYAALSSAARFSVIPVGRRESAFVANAAALTASLICGTGWYLMDLFGLYSGPWLAPVTGAGIALTIRLTSRTEAAYRALVSVASYLLTLMVVLFLLTHRDLALIYDSVESFQVYENTLVRTRLQDPLHIAAYLSGAVLAAQIGYFRSRG